MMGNGMEVDNCSNQSIHQLRKSLQSLKAHQQKNTKTQLQEWSKQRNNG
jgi:hypothetical protein